MKILMVFGAVLQLVAIGALVMCAVYLRQIAQILRHRGE